MKTYTFIPVLIVLLILTLLHTAFANDDKYIAAMQKQIDTFYKSTNAEQYQASINAFTRIAAAEKTRWEPYYYIGLGYVFMASDEQDPARKDAYLDQAMQAITNAKTLVPQESEVIALEGFAYMIRLSASPATRGPELAPKAQQAFQQAIALNADNPRAHALLAQMQLGSARFFGSPITEACASNTRALEKFDAYTSANPLAPRWGKRMAEALKTQCP